MLIWLLTTVLESDDAPSIGLQPYDKPSLVALQRVSKQVKAKFGFAPTVLPVRPLPSYAWYSPRQRYRAEKLLADLNLARGYSHVLGLTSKDISTFGHGQKDWGVLGLGQMPGKACVLSTFRLKRRLGTVSKNERLKRLAFHEIGHTLGLRHCPVHPCIMNDAEGSIKSLDEAGEFCPKCKRELGL